MDMEEVQEGIRRGQGKLVRAMPEARSDRTWIKGQAAGSASQDTIDGGELHRSEGIAELGEP